jgi:hypothetical protein
MNVFGDEMYMGNTDTMIDKMEVELEIEEKS